MSCPSDSLPALALGALPELERAAIDAHVVSCHRCARELIELIETAAQLPRGLVGPPPSPSVRARLLAAIERGGRFDDFAEPVAELYDVEVDRARRWLDRIDEPSRWLPGPAPGTRLLPVRPGPRYAGAMAGFLRVEAGARFPLHTHLGPETSLVLQGACCEPDGRWYRRRQYIEHTVGTAHDFLAAGDGPAFVAAVRVDGTIRLEPAG